MYMWKGGDYHNKPNPQTLIKYSVFEVRGTQFKRDIYIITLPAIGNLEPQKQKIFKIDSEKWLFCFSCQFPSFLRESAAKSTRVHVRVKNKNLREKI